MSIPYTAAQQQMSQNLNQAYGAGLAGLGQAERPMSLPERTASDRHRAADRLEAARAAFEQAQAAVNAAQHDEQEAWSALQVAAGRAPEAAQASRLTAGLSR